MPDDLQRVYANVVNVHGGPFEVTMDFGSRAADEAPNYEVRVMMSWAHLKLMLRLLQQQIAQYEEQVGTVPDLTIQTPDETPDA